MRLSPVVPIQGGSGMQFKILKALVCGVSVVATTVAKGDISLNEEEGLFVADEPNIFAERVVKILIDKNLRKSSAQKAPQAIKDKYSWETSNLGIEKIYSELISKNKRREIYEKSIDNRYYRAGWGLSCKIPS